MLILFASYAPSNSVNWDGVVANNSLYFAYNTTTGGQAIKLTLLTAHAAATVRRSLIAAVTFSGQIATTNELMPLQIIQLHTPVIYAILL